MTNKITESEIENFAIELLEKQGYEYIYAPDIAPDSDAPERDLGLDSTTRKIRAVQTEGKKQVILSILETVQQKEPSL